MAMRGRWTRGVGPLLAALVLAVSAGGALAQDGASPAGGHAEVIAHGVIPMPADELTWRLYDAAAGPADEAEPLTTEWPGFLLGGEDPTLVDVDGDRSVVAEGKATLVRAGVDLTVAALDGDEAGYGWLTLTDAGLDDDDALLLSSDAFDAPTDGEHQVDLVRGVLADDEETDIAAGAAPTVLLVVAGEASVTVDGPGGDSERLSEGDGYVADGLLTVRARDDDTVVLAAVIGDRVPAGGSAARTPTPGPTPDEAVGAIEFSVQTCAPGITVEEISDDVCPFTPPADGDLQLLTFAGTEQVGGLGVADAEVGQTGYVWAGLELRTHVLQVFASEPESIYVEETDQVAFIPGPQWEITLTEDAPYAFVPIYRLMEEIPAELVSTVTVTFLGCEPGQDPEVFLPENCYEPVAGSGALSGEDSGVYLGPDEAVANDDLSLTWTSLGYGRFALVDVVLPEGYVDYAQSEAVVSTGPDAPDADLYVYCFLPLEE